MENTLEVQGLRTYFFTYRGTVKAVDGVTFQIGKRETLGLIGETGSGKSVTALSVMRLIKDPGRIVGGKVMFEGENILDKDDAFMRGIRGRRIAMMFQEPTTSLNPVFTIGQQITDITRWHLKMTLKNAISDAIKKFETVGLSDVKRRLKQYPHELSGGMQQRVMIAMGISCGPSLLIADEPTTSLDVTIQSQILGLIRELRKRIGTSILYITHNLGVVAELCDRVAVMYAGKIVESAPVMDLFGDPRHPYTQGLLASLPHYSTRTERLRTIGGSVPDMIDIPSGCRFHPRCPRAKEICIHSEPELLQLDEQHILACHQCK